jgi:hypothetical protein
VTVWQIAAGDGDRDYHRLFVDFGLACVGPGDSGSYPENSRLYNERVRDSCAGGERFLSAR